MIVEIDVDDVTAESMGVWLPEYNRIYKDNLRKNQITDWYIAQFTKPECGERFYELFEDPSLYNRIAPLPGASRGVSFIKSLGHRVVFVTSATLGCAGRKYTWLKDHGFVDKMTDYVETWDKSLIKADIMIDDNFKNISSFTGFLPLLFRQPWNEKYPWDYECRSWDDVVKFFISIEKVDNASTL